MVETNVPRRTPDGNGHRWSFAALGLLALPVLCCGLPALLAAGGLAVIGGWLGTHGFWIGGAAAAVAAATLVTRWRAARRRCARR
jgi:hypothetical protein